MGSSTSLFLTEVAWMDLLLVVEPVVGLARRLVGTASDFEAVVGRDGSEAMDRARTRRVGVGMTVGRLDRRVRESIVRSFDRGGR